MFLINYYFIREKVNFTNLALLTIFKTIDTVQKPCHTPINKFLHKNTIIVTQ